jgi:hypothetical protein
MRILWILIILALFTIGAFAYATYMVEFAHSSQVFIINGNKYLAKTVCFNLYAGDRVMFIEGSPYGACSKATVVNMRNHEACELWCE